MQLRRAALSFLAAAIATSAASATALRVDGEPTSPGGCNLVAGDILRWKPSEGPPATFIAERFVTGGGNALIALGADAAGVWTAEMAIPSDGCDDCSVLRLVHTAFTGQRKSYLVAEAAKFEELGPSERRARVKQRLFELANGPWKVRDLSQRYRLRLVSHDRQGMVQRYTGWFAEMRVSDKPGLRFGVRSESFMCWCSDSWTAYPLRA